MNLVSRPDCCSAMVRSFLKTTYLAFDNINDSPAIHVCEKTDTCVPVILLPIGLGAIFPFVLFLSFTLAFVTEKRGMSSSLYGTATSAGFLKPRRKHRLRLRIRQRSASSSRNRACVASHSASAITAGQKESMFILFSYMSRFHSTSSRRL
jgi:hypothetical protein